MTSTSGKPGRLGVTETQILQGIHQHRLLTTGQAHALHAPHRSRRRTQRALARLRDAGLAAMARRPQATAVWYLTDAGADAVEQIPDRVETRRKVLDPAHAAGALQAHTAAVNHVGVAFVRAARERGDECGPYAWRHEVAHPIGPPPGRRAPEQLIGDAVLAYQLAEPDGQTSFLYRFVELDRATRAADDLANRLARYARLHRHTIPADNGRRVRLWPRLYPVFPTVLVVLAGRPARLLERRRQTVLALCADHPDLQNTPEVEISICLLDDLREHGPFAAICRTPARPDTPADWLGDTQP